MKYFCVSDVHSNYDALMEALSNAGFDANNSEHHFISLGDLLDRGKQPLECIRFVNNLPRKTLIRGNHEDLFDDVMARGYFLYHDFSNGTYNTFLDLSSDNTNPESIQDMIISINQNEEYNTYRNSLVNYAEIGNYILVHGWIPCIKKDNKYLYQSDWRQYGDWKRARWLNGMLCWHSGIVEEDKTIVCGHYHTSFGHYLYHNKGLSLEDAENADQYRQVVFDPFIDEGIAAIDATSAMSNKVNCYVFEV